MEFLKANYINTTTMISVQSNTATAKNIMNRDLTYQYYSDGYNDDTTVTSITISFDATTTISRIALMGINLKSFTLFYNGATASTFALTTTSATTTSNFSTNSETSIYMYCTAVDCTSVTLDMKTTIVANSEKAIGYFMLSNLDLDFARIPSFKNYKPVLDQMETVHKMSDGGVRVQRVQEKFRTTIRFQHVTETFRDSLRTIYDAHSELIFVAFGTTTSWDKVLYQCVWHGDWNFYEYSDDAASAGFTGTINLSEVTL